MEKRLIAQGPFDRKSYTVTLPIDWIRTENLSKKRLVDLTVVGRKVVISPKSSEQEFVQINGDAYSKVLIKVLQAFYRVGVDNISIQYTDGKVAEDTLSLIEQKLIGYEIIEHTANKMLIKYITRESEDDFHIIFRRLYLLLVELSESEDIQHIQVLKRNADKLLNYAQRILMKKGHTEYRKTPIYYLILDRLEKLGDEFYWLRNNSVGGSRSIADDLAKIFRISYELFYKFDQKKYVFNQQRSYEILLMTKPERSKTRKATHSFAVSRILNSLYGDVFAIHCDGRMIGKK